MTVAAAQLREWIEREFPRTPISRFSCRNTAAGSISQHSAYGSPRPDFTDKDDSNALDVFGPNHTTSPEDQAHVQRIVDAIREDGQHKWSIRKIIWRDGGAHENHAHIDFYPMITMKKWCGGPEIPTWRYSEGHEPRSIKTRDPEPENGRYSGGEPNMLGLGSIGTNVGKWQTYLNRWLADYQIRDQDGNPLLELEVDEDFGPKTEERTKTFQAWSNIEVTGTVGYFDIGTMAIAVGPDTGGTE